MDDYKQQNKRVWDEWAEINARSHLYRLEEFKQGENKLNPLERAEVGDVQGKDLLHLQCHFGMDTLSWARLGAKVTGMDFSPKTIQMAKGLSRELNTPAHFICCDLYDLPQHLDETFDIVFTSYGVLCWLPDLVGWAQLIARYLRPGGFFYIAEFHPFTLVFENERSVTDWRMAYSYFKKAVQAFPCQGSYADPDAKTTGEVEYEWMHPLGEVVTALLQAGLQLEFLHEHPFTVFQAFPFLVPNGEGYWVEPEGKEQLPLMFSLKARKPIS